MREKAIKFLTIKLKGLPEDALDKDSQDFVVTECKKVGFLEYGNLMLTCPCDVDLRPTYTHLYVEKFGFTGQVYFIFALKHMLSVPVRTVSMRLF